MKNFRIRTPDPSIHEDFTIRHAHLSRVTDSEIHYLRSISDFCINQINGGVQDVTVDKGSQYFVEDHTRGEVRKVFESCDFKENTASTINGIVSFSREDIVRIYITNKYTFHSGTV